MQGGAAAIGGSAVEREPNDSYYRVSGTPCHVGLEIGETWPKLDDWVESGPESRLPFSKTARNQTSWKAARTNCQSLGQESKSISRSDHRADAALSGFQRTALSESNFALASTLGRLFGDEALAAILSVADSRSNPLSNIASACKRSSRSACRSPPRGWKAPVRPRTCNLPFRWPSFQGSFESWPREPDGGHAAGTPV